MLYKRKSRHWNKNSEVTIYRHASLVKKWAIAGQRGRVEWQVGIPQYPSDSMLSGFPAWYPVCSPYLELDKRHTGRAVIFWGLLHEGLRTGLAARRLLFLNTGTSSFASVSLLQDLRHQLRPAPGSPNRWASLRD